MLTARQLDRIVNFRSRATLESLRRFALTHDNVKKAEITRNGKLLIGIEGPLYCEQWAVQTLAELRYVLGYC